MATQQPIRKTTPGTKSPVAKSPAAKVAPAEPSSAGNILFTKENYKWMVIGLVVMALGFFLMAGGKSPDPKVFNDNDIYSPVRITVAPILIVAGLLIEIFAIMKKPK